jgi:adenylate kinase family enzyme
MPLKQRSEPVWVRFFVTEIHSGSTVSWASFLESLKHTVQKMNKIMCVGVLGNSGSGKSTLAKAYGEKFGLSILDLDAVAWRADQPGVRVEHAESISQLNEFMDTHSNWVIEGCYAKFMSHVSPRCSEMVFLNPGIEACKENCRNRPWEPHKYPSKVDQDKNLGMLLDWVGTYENRTDEYSLAEHRKVFDGFAGKKKELISNQAAKEFKSQWFL